MNRSGGKMVMHWNGITKGFKKQKISDLLLILQLIAWCKFVGDISSAEEWHFFIKDMAAALLGTLKQKLVRKDKRELLCSAKMVCTTWNGQIENWVSILEVVRSGERHIITLHGNNNIKLANKMRKKGDSKGDRNIKMTSDLGLNVNTEECKPNTARISEKTRKKQSTSSDNGNIWDIEE